MNRYVEICHFNIDLNSKYIFVVETFDIYIYIFVFSVGKYVPLLRWNGGPNRLKRSVLLQFLGYQFLGYQFLGTVTVPRNPEKTCQTKNFKESRHGMQDKYFIANLVIYICI